MKVFAYLALAAVPAFLFISGCTKNNSYSTGDDKTASMTKVRHWKGVIHGYAKGDTLLNATDSFKTEWPKRLDRSIDTSEAALKINDLTISMNGIQMDYSTTSNATLILFDTTSVGTADRTSLSWYVANDSMVFIYHAVTGQNPSTGKYYYHNDTLHTVN